MIVVFIAGPFSASNAWKREQNIRRAEEVAFKVAELGMMPLCPHANTRNFADTLTDEFWYEGTLELMRRSDVVILLDNWQESKGAVREREEAIKLNKPIFSSVEELYEYFSRLSWCV